MNPHYADASVRIFHGDCLDVLRELPDASVDSVVTDPPYGLEFMGKEWDSFGKGKQPDIAGTGYTDGFTRLDRPAFTAAGNPHCRKCGKGKYNRTRQGCACASPDFGNPAAAQMRAFQQWCELWTVECLRVLKPGGHLLAFGGSRTWHRLASAVEDAGFEIRDSIAWLYGSGFPKSLDVSKAIDKAEGAEREVVGRDASIARRNPNGKTGTMRLDGFTTVAELRAAAEVGGTCPNGRDARTTLARLLARDVSEITAPATPDAERWQGWGTAMKPAHEPVVHGVKPYSDKEILARIGSQLDALEDACRRRVSVAARSSAPTPAASPEAKTDSARANAATRPEVEPASQTRTGAVAGSSEATGTSASEWTDETFSSTVTSWRACWVELWEATSTSTTSTATSRTTDLKTLSSCLSSITRSVTETSTPEPASLRSLVTAADNLFGAGVLSSRSTLALSAIESATSDTRQGSQGEGGSSPAFEPVVVARKPLAGTVAANVLTNGTGALNIDGCRIGDGADKGVWPITERRHADVAYTLQPTETDATKGRWPANVVLDGAMAAELDQQSGETASNARANKGSGLGYHGGDAERGEWSGDTGGGASRFFYVAKADASERPRVDGIAHPTVKPLALMRWLVRLVTPPGGTVLEPFAGSGTTVEACIVEGFHCVAIEREADYLPLIEARIARRRDPVRAIELAKEDAGLFALIEEESA